ncbi:MAG: invasion regulator SirB1 [Buchnera aphidicola (Eriosoma harunire)]
MTFLSNIDGLKNSLFESVIAVFSKIKKDFSKDYVLMELESRIKEAREYVIKEDKLDYRLNKLFELFYVRWNFGAASGIYELSEVLWIDNVLKTGKGTAVSLGIILLYIAQRLHLPLAPVIFPTQLILRFDGVDDQMSLINPFNGEILDKHTLRVWLKGNISPTAELYSNDLDKAKSSKVIKKMLDTLKSALMEEKKMELALQVSNVLLEIYPNDPYEIRDRGLIYAQLDCDHIALTDLIYFVEHCPEDPISEIIKVQIHAIEQRKLVLH